MNSMALFRIIAKKTLQFIYVVKGTRVTRVKQQIFFLDLILEHTLIDGIKEVPLQGNFPYMPHWKTVIIKRICMWHLVKLLKLSLLKLKLHTFMFARHCRINLITFSRWSKWILGPDFNLSRCWYSFYRQLETWSRTCLPCDMNPGPRYQPAD